MACPFNVARLADGTGQGSASAVIGRLAGRGPRPGRGWGSKPEPGPHSINPVPRLAFINSERVGMRIPKVGWALLCRSGRVPNVAFAPNVIAYRA
jgi:hypothetical protein